VGSETVPVPVNSVEAPKAWVDSGVRQAKQARDLEAEDTSALPLLSATGSAVPIKTAATLVMINPATRAPALAEASIFSGTTMSPTQKLVGPIIGGVVGAAAIGGVIAISVMKNPKITPAAPPAKPQISAKGRAPVMAPFEEKVTSIAMPVIAGANELSVADQAGFVVGNHVVIDAGTNVQEVNQVVGFGSSLLREPLKFPHGVAATVSTIPKAKAAALNAKAATPPARVAKLRGNVADTDFSSGLAQSTVITIAGALVACGILAVCIACLAHYGPKKKMKRKAVPQETALIPESYAPLQRGIQIDVLESTVDVPAMESHYAAVFLQPSDAGQPSSFNAPASFFTSQPPAAYLSGAGSVPTMMACPMRTIPPAQPRPSLWSPGAAPQFMPMPPLANTMSALPMMQLTPRMQSSVGMQLTPRIY